MLEVILGQASQFWDNPLNFGTACRILERIGEFQQQEFIFGQSPNEPQNSL